MRQGISIKIKYHIGRKPGRLANFGGSRRRAAYGVTVDKTSRNCSYSNF